MFTSDEAFGQNPGLRAWLAAHQVPFVLATRNDDLLTCPDRHRVHLPDTGNPYSTRTEVVTEVVEEPQERRRRRGEQGEAARGGEKGPDAGPAATARRWPQGARTHPRTSPFLYNRDAHDGLSGSVTAPQHV